MDRSDCSLYLNELTTEINDTRDSVLAILQNLNERMSSVEDNLKIETINDLIQCNQNLFTRVLMVEKTLQGYAEGLQKVYQLVESIDKKICEKVSDKTFHNICEKIVIIPS